MKTITVTIAGKNWLANYQEPTGQYGIVYLCAPDGRWNSTWGTPDLRGFRAFIEAAEASAEPLEFPLDLFPQAAHGWPGDRVFGLSGQDIDDIRNGTNPEDIGA